MKQQVKSYFEITKKEWNGMLVLLALMSVILAFPYLLPWFEKPQPMDLKSFDAAVAQLNKTKYNSNFANGTNPVLDKRIENPKLFTFNPNKLPVSQWQQLGLSLRQITLIKHYEAKGGRFYTKHDVEKMYSIDANDYTRLAPFIDLPDGKAANETSTIVELNTVDSATLVNIKGIGPALASRIITYRKQLGGFNSKPQLLEVYGIDSVKYRIIEPQLIINQARIRKIKINKATIDDLRPFPYLNFKQMNAIILYRNEHGAYHSINDLRPIVLLDQKILSKIEPYIAYQ